MSTDRDDTFRILKSQNHLTTLLLLIYLIYLSPASAWLQLNTYQKRTDYWLRDDPKTISGRSVKDVRSLKECVPNSRTAEGKIELDAVTIWNRPEFGGPVVPAVAFYNSVYCDIPTEQGDPPVVPIWIMILDQHRLPGLHVGNLKKLNAGFQWMSYKAFDVAKAQRPGGILEKYQGDLSGVMFGKARTPELQWIRFNGAIKTPVIGDWSKLTEPAAINAYMREVTEDVLLRGRKTPQQEAASEALLGSLVKHILPGSRGSQPRVEFSGQQQPGRRYGPGENNNVNIYQLGSNGLAPVRGGIGPGDTNPRYQMSPQSYSTYTPLIYQNPFQPFRQGGGGGGGGGGMNNPTVNNVRTLGPFPGRENIQRVTGQEPYRLVYSNMVGPPLMVSSNEAMRMQPWAPPEFGGDLRATIDPLGTREAPASRRDILRSFQGAVNKEQWLRDLWAYYGNTGNIFLIGKNLYNANKNGKLPTISPSGQLVWPMKSQPYISDNEDEEDEEEEEQVIEETSTRMQIENEENGAPTTIMSEETSRERVFEPLRQVQPGSMLIEEGRIPTPPIRGSTQAQTARMQEVPQTARTGAQLRNPGVPQTLLQRLSNANYAPSGQTSSQQSRAPFQAVTEGYIPIPNQASVTKLDFGKTNPRPVERIPSGEQIQTGERVNPSTPSNSGGVSRPGPVQQLPPITLQQQPPLPNQAIPENISPANQQERVPTVLFQSVGTEIQPGIFKLGRQEISEAIRNQPDVGVIRNPTTGSRNNRGPRVTKPDPDSGKTAAAIIEQYRQASGKPAVQNTQPQEIERVEEIKKTEEKPQIVQQKTQIITEVPVQRANVAEIPISNQRQADLVQESAILPPSEIIKSRPINKPFEEVPYNLGMEPLKSIPTGLELPPELTSAQNLPPEHDQDGISSLRPRIYSDVPALRGIPVTYRRTPGGAFYPIPAPPSWTPEDETYALWNSGRDSWIKPERVTRNGRDYAIDTTDLDYIPPLKEGEIVPIYLQGFNDDEWNPPDPWSDDDEEPELLPGARRLVRPVMRSIFRDSERPYVSWDEFYARQRGWVPSAGGPFAERELFGPDIAAARDFFEERRDDGLRNGRFGWHKYADLVRKFLRRAPLKPEDARLGEEVKNLAKDLGEGYVPLERWIDEVVKPEDVDKFRRPDDYDVEWDDVEKTLVTKKIKPNTSSVW
ncbi:hypothetical protein AA313_de0206290 [Arthrobotrys entomopaga]|nr:hypothetical protein AA313_de0206290 [Arthrobotrys entomopaga]